MTRKLGVAVAAVAVGALVAGGVAFKLLRGDSRIQRGRELLSIDEVDGAVIEFKLALRSQPESREAKAYLLFATERRARNLERFLAGAETARVVSSPALLERASPAVREELEATVKAERRRLYDQGVDTANAAEVVALADELARICFSECADGPARDASAAVLARNGSGAATAFLVDRLKNDRAVGVEALLASVGERASEKLLEQVKNPEYLARARALRALAQIGIGTAARQMFESSATLRGLAWEDVPADLRIPGAHELFDRGVAHGLTRSAVLHGVASDQSPKTKLHAQWLSFDEKADRALLVLQGFEPDRSAVSARTFVFLDGRWAPVRFTRTGGEIGNALEGGGPVVRIRTSTSGRVEFVKLSKGVVEEERLSERSAFKTGDAVAIAGQPARGAVVGPGQYGLVRVRLTQEWDGRTDHDLSPEFLRFVDSVKVERARFRVLTGRLVGDGKSIDLDTESPLVPAPPDAPMERSL